MVFIDSKDMTGGGLHHAVVIDHKYVVKILLEAGADIETTDLADHIPIGCAAPPGNDKNRSGRVTPSDIRSRSRKRGNGQGSSGSWC